MMMRTRRPWTGSTGRIEATMAEWKVPGLALAVVKEGRVVLLKGYG